MGCKNILRLYLNDVIKTTTCLSFRTNTLYILIYRYKYEDSTNAYIGKIHIDTNTKGIVQAQAELPVFVPLICFADYRRPYN